MKQKIYHDEYLVKIDYPRPDGYWVCSHEAIIEVPVPWDAEDGGRHEEARQIARKKWPGCHIKKVT